MNSEIEQLASLAHSQLAHQGTEQSQGMSNGGTKRKPDDEQGASGKSKRSRYISLACNECKRRKIKCNGQNPCARCGNLNLECVYAPNCCTSFRDSQEFKDMSNHIASLQEQVNQLYENLNSLRAQLGHAAPLQQPLQQPAQLQSQSQYQQLPSIDPSLQTHDYHENANYPHQTSPEASRPRSQAHNQSTFRSLAGSDSNFSTVNSSLQMIGVQAQEPEDTKTDAIEQGDVVDHDGERLYDPSTFASRPGQLHDHIHEEKDPIWLISHKEAIRLCRIYDDETRLMYPILDISKITAHADKLFPFLAAMRRSGLMQQGMPGADAIEDENTNVLKTVLAIALTVENGGHSELGVRFFDAVQPTADQLVMGDDANVNTIRRLLMMTIYEFQQNHDKPSWRLVGLAAQLCVELGLHRRATYDGIEDESQKADTLILFWTCYVLDRRWGLGTGMPSVLKHTDVDPTLPRPGDRYPYLMAMIKYGEIEGKIWLSVEESVSAVDGGISRSNIERMSHLDHQVLQWHRSLPHSLQYDRTDGQVYSADSISDRSSFRSKLVSYLRANHVRILIHRPILHSATTIMQHPELAQKVIQLAKDTMQVLTSINQSTDLYRTQQTVFHASLSSALGVLFLAVSHAPISFAAEVRDEFYMALDMLRGISRGSFFSERLWRTICSLKEVAPKMDPEEEASVATAASRHEVQRTTSKNDADPSRSAAVAMAGLAGHNVDEAALFDDETPQTWSFKADATGDPDKMTNDLVRLFEVAVRMPEEAHAQDRIARESATDRQLDDGQQAPHASIGAAIGEDELFNVLKDLF